MTMIQQKSDAELVGEYARTRSDTAFAAIVQRHVNAVYGAAWRQVRDAALAEDITQAVFIVLAKQAHRIHDPRLLAGWLLKVTRYCAADARKFAARREFHEQRAAAMKSTISEGNAMEPDIAEHLDAHLAALGAVDRAAIVLRCLEERPLVEVARELQMSEEAAKKRVARALEKLRKLFVRKGVTLSAVVLVGALAKQSVAAPPTLVSTICAAAATKTAGSATAAILTKGALKMMAWTTVKLTTAAAAGLIVIAGTAAAVVHVAASAPVAHQEAATVAAPESEPSPDSQPPAFVYVMGKVQRPGVWQLTPGFTVQKLFRRLVVAPGIATAGWLTLVRNVGHNTEHRITVPIADFIAGVNVPPLARELQGNDVLNVGVDAPDAPRVSAGCVSIIGDVRNAGSYDVFGRLITTREALVRFAKPTAPLDQLVVSVLGVPVGDALRGQNTGQVIAQIKMADVLAGKVDDYFVCPGDTIVVRTLADNNMPPPVPKKPGLAIIPADRPPGADGHFEVQGDVNRPGVYSLSAQKITVKMAVAAFGLLPPNLNHAVTLRRKVDGAPDKVIPIHVQAIFDGTEADRFLQDGDVITVSPTP